MEENFVETMLGGSLENDEKEGARNASVKFAIEKIADRSGIFS
jgi:hypothetical protein